MSARPDRRAYRAARLIDGLAERPLADHAIVVESAEITWAGPAGAVPPGVPVHDLGDVTLLPGLVDCHVHLVWDASAAPHEVVARETPARTALRAAARAREQLDAGVTTVRDVGASDGVSVPLAQAVAHGDVIGPRIVACGRAIAMTGGHGWFLGREADGPDAVRAAVRAELKAGARAIKLMASGGVYGEHEFVDQPQLTLDELRAGVEEARKGKCTVAAHAYAPGPIRTALEAGVDSIEHGSFLDLPTAELMRARGTFLVPTMSVYDAMARHAPALGSPEYIIRKTEEVRTASLRACALAREVGVPLAAGTDCGAPGHPHGTLPEELRLMVTAGLSPREALGAGTLGGARLLRLDDEIGTLEVGKRADLLAVGGDPSSDIGALHDVRLVVAAGREHRRSS